MTLTRQLRHKARNFTGRPCSRVGDGDVWCNATDGHAPGCPLHVPRVDPLALHADAPSTFPPGFTIESREVRGDVVTDSIR